MGGAGRLIRSAREPRLGQDFLNHFRVTIGNARGVVELAPK